MTHVVYDILTQLIPIQFGSKIGMVAIQILEYSGFVLFDSMVSTVKEHMLTLVYVW